MTTINNDKVVCELKERITNDSAKYTLLHLKFYSHALFKRLKFLIVLGAFTVPIAIISGIIGFILLVGLTIYSPLLIVTTIILLIPQYLMYKTSNKIKEEIATETNINKDDVIIENVNTKAMVYYKPFSDSCIELQRYMNSEFDRVVSEACDEGYNLYRKQFKEEGNKTNV